ncbi:MAG TPA: TonB-dependent receptor [Daejeonella sp.]
MKRSSQPFFRQGFYSQAGFSFILFFNLFLCSLLSFAQEFSSIKGTVRSSRGELLSGVTVLATQSRIITQTDDEGAYLINSVPLNITLTFSRLGYKAVTIDLGLLPSRENIQDIILSPEVQSLDEINITEKFSGSNFKLVEPAKFSAYPTVSGSFESLIKNMPGVSANNELSSQYSVRGGNFDENLLYLNDIEIFRPLSISKGQQESLGFINPDMASNVRFSAGGFEARYGDKLSSVLDVRYSRPDSFSAEASAGFLGSSATLKLPFKGSYVLAGVRNKRNQDLLERQNLRGNYKSKFLDYQLLYKQDIGTKFNVSLFGNYNTGELDVVPGERETEFGTSDEVLKLYVNYDGLEATKYKTGVAAITFAYNFSNSSAIKWISSVTGLKESEDTKLLGWYSFDERDGGLDGGSNPSLLGRGSQYDFTENRVKSVIYNSELRIYKQYKRSFLEMGARFQNDRIRDNINEYVALDSTSFSSPGGGNWIYSDIIDEETDISINRINGFLQNTFSLNPYLTFAAGIRANYNSFTKETLISPRLSFMYYPGNSERFLLRFSGGSYVQPPHYKELRNYDGSLNPRAKSQRSFQLLSGADYKFNGLGTKLKFTSEVYYKFLSRLTPYKTDDLKVRYFSDQESKGYAAGADFSLSGNFARDLESTFRLSYMKTEEDIKDDFYLTGGPGIPGAAVRPGYLKRPTDQRINLGILFQDRLLQNPTYKVHLNLLFASALPTGPAGSQRYQDVFKIPAYKRVDIGFSKDFADQDSRRIPAFIKKYFQSLSAHAEIFNLLNNKNTASYLWLKDARSVQYAVPNYLTFRKFNFRIIAELKSR